MNKQPPEIAEVLAAWAEFKAEKLHPVLEQHMAKPEAFRDLEGCMWVLYYNGFCKGRDGAPITAIDEDSAVRLAEKTRADYIANKRAMGLQGYDYLDAMRMALRAVFGFREIVDYQGGDNYHPLVKVNHAASIAYAIKALNPGSPDVLKETVIDLLESPTTVPPGMMEGNPYD